MPPENMLCSERIKGSTIMILIITCSTALTAAVSKSAKPWPADFVPVVISVRLLAMSFSIEDERPRNAVLRRSADASLLASAAGTKLCVPEILRARAREQRLRAGVGNCAAAALEPFQVLRAAQLDRAGKCATEL